MFCSGCGTELEAGLNFCKRCGKALAVADLSKVSLNLTNALGAIGVFGMMGFGLVLYLMLRSPIISPGTIMLVSFFYLATLLSICFLILRQTAAFTSRNVGRLNGGDSGPATPAYLRPASTNQLTDANDQSISVTEHTTKDLEAIPARRK
jgi:hypothetical protein